MARPSTALFPDTRARARRVLDIVELSPWLSPEAGRLFAPRGRTSDDRSGPSPSADAGDSVACTAIRERLEAADGEVLAAASAMIRVEVWEELHFRPDRQRAATLRARWPARGRRPAAVTRELDQLQRQGASHKTKTGDDRGRLLEALHRAGVGRQLAEAIADELAERQPDAWCFRSPGARRAAFRRAGFESARAERDARVAKRLGLRGAGSSQRDDAR